MTWSDVKPFLLGAVGGLLVWLLGYAGKHTLDRLLLPKALDWLSYRNRNIALQRANNVLRLFEYNVRRASNVNTMILVSESRLVLLILFSCVVNSMLVIAVWPGAEDLAGQLAVRQLYAFVTIPTSLVLFYVYIVIYIHSEVGNFENLPKYREETLIRLRKLLARTHLVESEIDEWLNKVPHVPDKSQIP